MNSLTTETAAGPEELLRLKREYLVPCVYHFYKNPPQIVAGEGCHLVDHAGRRYLDCYSGVTVMSAGHCVEEIIEPAIAQMRMLQHTTSIYLTEPVLRLAEALATITPPGLKRSFFCASGTEAVEGALLLAALHTKRDVVIAMANGLHGRTRWAMNVTGLAMWRTDPFPMSGVIHVEFGNLVSLEAALRNFAGRVAAVIGEPIQGNAGIVVPPDNFWPGVRRLCDEHGAVLVLDEIQTGFNRTGRWFACEHWGVRPDVMAISKAMGNGFPIAAFVTTDAIAASYTRPGASTYGGNPVSAAAALAVIEFHKQHSLTARAARSGDLLRAGLMKLARRHASHLRSPHGLGLMVGMAVTNSDGAPSAEQCDLYLERLKDAGVLAGKTGPNRNVLTFMPPLTIGEDDVEKVIDAMDMCAE
jgi:4-aminobutyrate aminotransferase/4-aminobutyrate aminotransferase/(S)-3-amino-2-methylpropionate transaminase